MRTLIHNGFRYLCWLFFVSLQLSCIHRSVEVPNGVASEHAGYVPARIAVINCQMWPSGARYKKQPLTNVPEGDLAPLCAKLDEFVLSGFKDQPYMRGYSPAWVEKFLEQANAAGLSKELPKLWAHQKSDCKDCMSAASFYKNSIEARTDWRLWLSKFSDSVRHADAVLMPFITYAYDSEYTDRGLVVAKRAVGVSILLVDTNAGYLLWSSARDAYSSSQKLFASNVDSKPALPGWDEVYQRSFVEDLWAEFPGRQFYK